MGELLPGVMDYTGLFPWCGAPGLGAYPRRITFGEVALLTAAMTVPVTLVPPPSIFIYATIQRYGVFSRVALSYAHYIGDVDPYRGEW